ncbi:hypothetical protein KBD45_04635 [Candidatus Dojkabacteria bacterium]|nr:hypothetical protein [Candidatus Dojkabacteria bacterium]
MDVIINQQIIKTLTETWINYYISNKDILFKKDPKHTSIDEILDTIRTSGGFQITAFAGKIQNQNTHPQRLPDLGELNLLCKIKAIQDLTGGTVQIILDGEYYSDIFGEDNKIIKKYEKQLMKFANLVGLNKGLANKPLISLKDYLQQSNISYSIITNLIEIYQKSPEIAFESTGMLPEHFFESIKKFFSDTIIQKYKTQEEYHQAIYNMSKEFIIRKAALTGALKLSKVNSQNSYKRITILKYKNFKYPRLNIQMKMAPWNSTIIFKKSYLNINTAQTESFTNSKQDIRNYQIIDNKGYFWGFSRKPNLFEKLLQTRQ